MNNTVGTVATLWRFPVKSMRGEALESEEIEDLGIPGDRAFALIDQETGKIVNAVNVKRYPNLFQFKSRYSMPPRVGQSLPEVIIELPDGREVGGNDPRASEAISAQLGQEVRLVAFGQAGPDASATGKPFHDAFPISVLTTATLRTMNQLQPDSVFDARRFRMNVIIESDAPGFPENEWVGQALTIGEDFRLEITQPDARCIMTTLAQDELAEDRSILTGLVKHNRLPVGEKGRYPCAGVYARVLTAGMVSAGDAVLVGLDR